MILLNYLVFLGKVALVMTCVAGLLITEIVRFSLLNKKIDLEIYFCRLNFC